MKKFILSRLPDEDSMIHLDGKDYHYLVRVRRLKAGMSFKALLPGGRETEVKIISTAGNILKGECIKPDPLSQGSGFCSIPEIVLFQAIPKAAKMDLIVRQATEAEVSIIVPFFSEYSIAEMGMENKKKRWERIIREARQQSGSGIETEIRDSAGPEEILGFWQNLKNSYKNPLGIFLHQSPLEKGSFHRYLDRKPDITVLAIGPEGGFSPGEITMFENAGFKSLLIGNSILRTETAALYGIAVIRTLLMENKDWSYLQKE